ncbi:hypothetical protein R0K17_27135, partial [Planococcus sp. SIMBA_143]
MVLAGITYNNYNNVVQEASAEPLENAKKIEDDLEDYLDKDLDDLCVLRAAFDRYIIGDEEEGKQY